MIIDKLENAARYHDMHKGFDAAFQYLLTSDLSNMPNGKYPIVGDEVFAIVQEYDTVDATNEQMESHRKHIDIQYIIEGCELVGLDILGTQQVSKSYSDEEDFMLYANAPAYFARFDKGNFMIFYPTDLHMPCIKAGESGHVKKVVIKVTV